MTELIEKRDVTPLCPYCEQGLQKIYFRELTSLLGRRYVYFCGKCHKTLGISHRKGFWMG